ncbi:MAG: DUF305 domain-containing protein [Pseudomonadota bacterium]
MRMRTLLWLTLCVLSTSSNANNAPIVQPGAPGEATRPLSARQAIEIANSSFSPDDVKFMQAMIPHHQQAVEMANLVEARTNRPELTDVAGRIKASQEDEMKFMRDWLGERGQGLPDKHAAHAMYTSHKMAGMASAEDMAKLATLTGTDFDRLFLTLMITHHEGAITMVEELMEQPGAAYDPTLFEFTNDVTNDQNSEIERMHALLVSLSEDPRANLKPGFMDAGEAILNLTLVGSLAKPAGFFDPDNPAELPPEMPEDEEEDEPKDGATEDAELEEKPEEYDRYPLLSFSNTDMAFRDDVLFAGSYHGFNIYRLSERELPELLSSVVCPGGQGDVSIVEDLLIMSVEQTRGRLDCGLEGIGEDISNDRFRGLRIFDISDLTQPRQVGAVQTCRGSHTHSVVSADDKRIVVYNSGTAMVRDEEELDGCSDTPGDMDTALFRIDVIEIPIAQPNEAKIVHSPAVFADPDKDTLAGLWRGGDHGEEDGEETQDTNITDQCHDITVFPAKNLAAGACSGNGILFDISDPLDPQRLDAVTDTGFAYWHSATFNNAGTKVVFTDEWGGGGRPRCRAFDPLDWGADAFYDIVDNKLEFKGYFKIPAPQLEQENCVAHNGSIIPVPGRDLFVQAWYQGGMSIVDFTDAANPVEIAYFDRGPIDADHMIVGGYWSTYYYNGRIYGTEIVRGLDVFELQPSEHLSAAEIAAAGLANDDDVFNPQQQMRIEWPAQPIIAEAYLDQLARDKTIDQEALTSVRTLVTRAAERLTRGAADTDLARALRDAAATIGGGDKLSERRVDLLNTTLRGLSAQLR